MSSYNLTLNRDLYWRLLTVLGIAILMLIISDSAFASAGNDIIGITLCKLTQNLTGGTAKAIATLAIFTVGCGLFMGKMDWKTAAMVAVGVGIIFGAPQLVNWISSSAGTNCPTA
jgi:type IV secretory pathway VirB2 component (pilin)